MKKILISGYFGFDNFGDEALLYVTLKDLNDLGIPKENITVISNNTGHTTFNYGVRTLNRWNISHIVRGILKNDILIFTGGLFQDKTSFISFLYYFFQLFLAGIFQKSILLYGAGIGPFKGNISISLFKFAVSAASAIIVRDEASVDFLPCKENIFVTCDPVWSIIPSNNFKNKIPNVNWNLPILGISMRIDKHLKMHHITNLAEKISKVMNDLKDWQILLIPSMPSEDLHVLYELYDLLMKKVPGTNRIILLDYFNKLHISEQAGILARCDVMVGMRYHSLLVPIANGKPVFGIIYDQKVKSLLDFTSQVGIALKDDLEQPWSYFWQNLQHSSAKAKEAAGKAQQLQKRNLELLSRFIR